jgi:hypothetical protein
MQRANVLAVKVHGHVVGKVMMGRAAWALPGNPSLPIRRCPRSRRFPNACARCPGQ